MIRRNLTVVFKPSKNNAVQLPAEFFNAVQQYQERGCIRLTYSHNRREHYAAWAPQAGNLRDAEIGINSNVAKALGLNEGAIVTCACIADAPALATVTLLAYSPGDYAMLDASSYRIQNTLLDQTRVVTRDQKLVVWINPALKVVVAVRRLSPDVPYGRLCPNSEVIISPFNPMAGIEEAASSTEMLSTAQLEERTQMARLDRRLSQVGNGSANGHHASNGAATNGKPLVPMGPAVPNRITDCYDANGEYIAQNMLTPTCFSTLDLEDQLRPVVPVESWFRLIAGKWDPLATQLYDVFTTSDNLPAAFDTSKIFELYGFTEDCGGARCFVNIKRLAATPEEFPNNAYPTIEVPEPLLRTLELTELQHIRLTQYDRKVTAILRRIELVPVRGHDPAELREMELRFKQLVVSSELPVLLNQGEVVAVGEDRFVTVRLEPKELAFACVDGAKLRQCPVSWATGETKAIVKLAAEPRVKGLRQSQSFVRSTGFERRYEYVRLDKLQEVIERVTAYVVNIMGLDSGRGMADRFNIVVSGKSKSGKTQICKQILEALAAKPYHCYTAILDCTTYKGRKPEQIERELREMFSYAKLRLPAVFVLDNLDALTPQVGEQSQDGEYSNQVSDVIRRLILLYTENRQMCVIATCVNPRLLNRRMQKSRGLYTFNDMSAETPQLDRDDREQILRELTAPVHPKRINFRKIANQTEGYAIGDLAELAQRAVFFAHKQCPQKPELGMQQLVDALAVTAEHVMHGIEQRATDGGVGDSAGDSDGSDAESVNSDDSEPRELRHFRTHPFVYPDPKKVLAGLGHVVKVLEQVLMWPAKYQQIFANSPLRNQAGVLLYGPPGTGKTYAVGQLARLWRLRLISVKGPELLAKYIGQSEENVRMLFEKARKMKPCVLFFDEFDSLAPKRGHDNTGVTDRVVNQLLTELDGVQGLDGVIVIAATSRPDMLDGALLRSGRIDRLVEIPMPAAEERAEILRVLARTVQLAEDCDLAEVAERAENFTGADLQSVLTSASMAAVNRVLLESNGKAPEEVIIQQQHLLEALAETRPSLTPALLADYKRKYAPFSNPMEAPQTTQDFVQQRATLA